MLINSGKPKSQNQCRRRQIFEEEWPTGRAQYDFLPEVNTLRIKAKDPVSGGTQSPD